ncbi:hypothetical protein [Mycobacterium sp. OTB74]|jgi:hypothetical protein|uniref:hypothetical protein n=1 Tax=Mycobacterium sp. OTB74 TaxID=1853452 RepID=UPI0024742D76|nr:hypothetical protein [Mycobacterium sp. OTB74]MDH6245975.1 hypothetical protein [Mycobacterium sp. OTB74]
MKFTHNRRIAIRVVRATASSGFAAIALAAPASADTWHEHFAVDQCTKPWTQWCKNVETWTTHYPTSSDVWITADPTHCSDIIAHVRIDGEAMESYVLGPGQRTAAYRVPAGEHEVAVQAEGVNGGCNRGYLAAWGGTVHFQVLGSPQNFDGPNGEG